MPFQPFNLGEVYQTAEAVRGARKRNALADIDLRREEQLNALSANKNATAEDYARIGRADIGNALTNAQRFSQEQQINNTKLLHAAASEIEVDPSSAARWLPQLQQAGIVRPGIDLSSIQPQQLQQLAGQLKKSTAAALTGLAGPQQQGEGFSLSPGQKRFDAAGKVVASVDPLPREPSAADINRTFTRADKLRDEYNAASKEFVTVGDAFTRVQGAAQDPTAAGDLSMIFAYMKMLDPNSVVREQEFANAQNAAGIPDRIRTIWNKALAGERLSERQRADFLGQATKLYSNQRSRHEATIKKRYTEMAKRFNVRPEDVVGDFDVLPSVAAPPAEAAPAPAPQQQITATGPNGQKLILQNWQWVPLRD